MKKIFKYQGMAYRQGRDALTPWLVSIVVPAEELLEWAGIPRRSETDLMGFQRAYDPKRVQAAREFFVEPANVSPTAVVVGVHPSHDEDVRLELLDSDGPDASAIRPCRLEVEWNDDQPLDAIVELVAGRIDERLANESDSDLGDVDEDRAEDEEESQEDLDEDGDVHEFEMGRSILERLRTRLDEPAWAARNEDDLRDMAKPATIIDGQHRIKGAEALEEGLPFAACVIYGCPWPEQVFQFTVVNYTARGIPDQFITANAALSLTEGELQQLQTRLVQAGVKVVEYELMRVVHFDPRSPFQDLVSLGEKKEQGKIGYKTMVRVAREWYSAKHQVFNLLLPNLYPTIKGARKKTRLRERWKESGDWADFFLAFWNTIHREYAGAPSHVPGATLWDVGASQLMVAIVLYEVQSAFLRNLNAQDEDFFQVDSGDSKQELLNKLRRRAEKFAEYIPPDFFSTAWASKSLSIGPGRAALEDALRELVDKKGAYQYGKSVLVTGKTT